MTVKEISDISNLTESARELVREDSTPASYLDSLEKRELYQDAIRFQAHNMATDAGVKWAVSCAREMKAPESKDRKDEPLDASDAWIKAPGDATRWKAKEAFDRSKDGGASDLIAMAVFFSGGSISSPGAPETSAPPYTAQKMIAGSIIVAVVSHEPEKAGERYKRALAMAKSSAPRP